MIQLLYVPVSRTVVPVLMFKEDSGFRLIHLFNILAIIKIMAPEENNMHILADYISFQRDYKDSWMTFSCRCSSAKKNF